MLENGDCNAFKFHKLYNSRLLNAKLLICQLCDPLNRIVQSFLLEEINAINEKVQQALDRSYIVTNL